VNLINGGEERMNAKWDFPVVKRPIKEDIVLEDGSFITPPGNRYVIFNEETQKSFSIVSGRYQLIPHRTVLEAAREIIGKSAREERIRVEKGGARTSIYFSLWRFDASGGEAGDTVEMGVRITNSYDGLSSLTIELAGQRLVCSNGMTAPAKGTYSYHQPHVGQFDEEEFKKALEASVNKVTSNISDVRNVFEEAFRETYERNQVKALLSGLDLPPTYIQLAWTHLEEGNDGKDEFSRWEVYNALTHAISHYNMGKSVVTKGRYEREAYSVLYDIN